MTAQSSVEDDDDDWQELEKAAPSPKILPVAAVKCTQWGKSGPVRSSMVLRREAAQWIFANEPRFRIQIGGDAVNKIRITPDKDRGKFEVTNFKGVARLALGHINAWPNESRESTEATFEIVNGSLLLTLPKGFAKPGSGVVPLPRLELKKKPDPAPAIKVTTSAPGLSERARVIDRRPSEGPVSFGDPPRGRSALDQRKNK